MSFFIKLYEKIKQYILQSYKIIIFFLVLNFILTFELNFSINTYGDLIDLKDKINITNSTKSTGSFNLTYVKEIKGTIPTLIVSKFNKNWDYIKKDNKEITLNDYIISKIFLEESIDNAIYNAYTKAHKEIRITKKYFNVINIDESAKTDLKIGDIITHIDNEPINDFEDITKLINQKEIKKVKIKVINGNKKYNRTAELIKKDNKKFLGINLSMTFDYDTLPGIKTMFEKSESGPSGGLMLSLQIYDSLVEKDLTNKLIIAGTGTIDSMGNIGEIGGIKYKIKGACKESADIFLTPLENYQEALSVKEKQTNCKTKIYSVSTFEEAINILENQ